MASRRVELHGSGAVASRRAQEQMLHSAIARVSEQQLYGRVVLLVIGRDLAAQVASDGLATPAERDAARVFGGYIRARLRRSLDMLGGTSAELAAAVGDYLLDCDVEVKPRKDRRNAPVVSVGA